MANVALRASAQFTPRASSGQFIQAYISPAVRASIQAATEFMADEARRLAPERSGRLKGSIHPVAVEDTGKTVVGGVAADAPYAGYVEYGTGRRGAGSAGAGPYDYNMNWPGMVAQPYMRPAREATKQVIRDLMASQIALALQR